MCIRDRWWRKGECKENGHGVKRGMWSGVDCGRTGSRHGLGAARWIEACGGAYAGANWRKRKLVLMWRVVMWWQ
eukprot:2934740-Prorocentrum_lima.AAC.1